MDWWMALFPPTAEQAKGRAEVLARLTLENTQAWMRIAEVNLERSAVITTPSERLWSAVLAGRSAADTLRQATDLIRYSKEIEEERVRQAIERVEESHPELTELVRGLARLAETSDDLLPSSRAEWLDRLDPTLGDLLRRLEALQGHRSSDPLTPADLDAARELAGRLVGVARRFFT